MAADRCVNLARERDIEIRAAELRTMAGQDPKTFKRSMEEIHERWLLIGFTDATSRIVFVNLIDPDSGSLLDSFEYEQTAVDEAQRQERYANAIKKRENTAEEILAWVMWALHDEDPKYGTKANFLFMCPECRNKKTHRKKFAVDAFKGHYGAYYCYDCRVSGALNKLIATRCGFLDSLIALRGIRREQPRLYEKASELMKQYGPDGYEAAA
jgi:hypothetical protein